METLSSELLREILDHIETDPEKTVNIDRRAYLSVESFAAPCAPAPAQAQDIANFRLVCRRFADLGVPHQFTRVTTRFSKRGFHRLEWIAARPELARHVRKFSYMIPCFYVRGRERVKELFLTMNTDTSTLDPAHFIHKARDQADIVQTRIDVRALRSAISAFTSLQHVQILRIQDEPDRLLWEYIRENHDFASQYVELKWMPACVHGTRTMGEALLSARSNFTRFSGPMMDPQSALALQSQPADKLSSLASRLTCLELHFDEGVDLDRRMRALAPSFQTIFSAATGMQALHIGFPSRAPLDLQLEELFHHVRWERLRAFGIQAWRLDAEEIMALARRHRKTLRGLRLRDVLLREPSRWKTVLAMLHDEMEMLDWVSLRRIGYSRGFDDHLAGTMEVPPDPPGGGSDSDVEDGFPDHLGGSQAPDANDDDADDDDDDDDDDEDDDDDASTSTSSPNDDNDNDDENDDHGPAAHALALGTHSSLILDPDTPTSAPWCTCSRATSYPTSAEELGDNGEWVTVSQRKMWEKWVVGRCAEHS